MAFEGLYRVMRGGDASVMNAWLKDGMREALDLVTPCFCAGCGRLGEALCWRCESALYEPPSPVELSATEMPVWAVSAYEGGARRAILAWKRGRVDLAPRIAAAYQELADRWRAASGEEIGAVIPAPSGWRRRLRGLYVVGDAATAVGQTLDVHAMDVLRVRGGGHSGGLSAAARSRHAGKVRVTRRDLPARVLVVDDVVTTGVTLDSSARALAAEGVTVAAALVLAATPRRTRM